MKMRYIVGAWLFMWLLFFIATNVDGLTFVIFIIHGIMSGMFALGATIHTLAEYEFRDKQPRW